MSFNVKRDVTNSDRQIDPFYFVLAFHDGYFNLFKQSWQTQIRPGPNRFTKRFRNLFVEWKGMLWAYIPPESLTTGPTF
ncbi:MAG TPA: hypothetical protein VH415_06195 [Nitrososphaeraceae archaeon]|jgi:hypothetical protein